MTENPYQPPDAATIEPPEDPRLARLGQAGVYIAIAGVIVSVAALIGWEITELDAVMALWLRVAGLAIAAVGLQMILTAHPLASLRAFRLRRR